MFRIGKIDTVDDLIKNLIFLVYFLLFMEGVLRKWIFPGLSSQLFFIKDIVIIYIYILAFGNRKMQVSPFLSVTFLMCILFYVLVSLQSFILEFQMYVALYGWRNYCLYIPYAFIVGQYYREEEMIKVAKFTCQIAIPIAILVFLQYKSPVDSYINKNVGFGKSEIFTIAQGIVRPSGPFSFTTGISNFISVLYIMLVYNFFWVKKLS
jgi:hypothetical protein